MAIRHKTTMDISTQVSLKKCVCNLKENYIKFRKNFVKMSIGYLTEIRYPKQTEEILKDNRREEYEGFAGREYRLCDRRICRRSISRMAEIYYGRWKNRAAFGPFAFGRTGNKKLEEVEKCQKK